MLPNWTALAGVGFSESYVARETRVKALYATIMVLSLAGVAAATPGKAPPEGERQTFVLEEWTWSTGTTTTTFTAFGPPDQVNQLDPLTHPLGCEGCELASSIQFEPEAEAHSAVSR